MDNEPQTTPETVPEGAEAPPEAMPTITEYLQSNQPQTASTVLAATTAPGSDEEEAGAGPASSSEAVPPAEELLYRLGTWSGIPAVFCNWKLPNHTVCNAGFLREEEFWDHHSLHIIREMTPEQRTAAVAAAQMAGKPSGLVDGSGRPL